MIGPNEIEKMAKERPDECFLKGSGVLKLTGAIRDLEGQVRASIMIEQNLNDRIADLERQLAAAQPTAQQVKDAIRLPPFNDDLAEILGRMCFQCVHIANLLRASGQVIERKAEAEQAAVIYWLLDMYAKHGDAWREKGNDILSGFAALQAGKEKEHGKA